MDGTIQNRTFNEEEQRLLEEILTSRRDVRGNRFLPKEIDEPTIKRIIKAGLSAPSVGYSQPWEFVVIQDATVKTAIKKSFTEENEKGAKQFKDKKNELYNQLKLEGIEEAPLNIAVFYTPKNTPVLGQTSMPNMGRYSVVCAIQNIWLMARSLNIGMGWVSILDPEKVKTILNAPKTYELIGYLCLGYTDLFYDKPELELKKWDTRKPYEQVVIENTYK